MPAIITSRTRLLYERPPPGPLCINWAHHSSRGIVAAWPFGGGVFGGFNIQNPTRYKFTMNNSPTTKSTSPGGYATGYNGSNQDSELASTAVIATAASNPCTLETYCLPTNAANQQALVVVENGDTGTAWYLIELAGNVAGDPARAQNHDPSALEDFATSVNGYILNRWNHVLGSFATTTSRFVMLNGVGYGANTTARASGTALSRTMLGAFRVSSSYFSPFSGDLHSAIIRNQALSPSEARERADPGLMWSWVHQLNRVSYGFLVATGIQFDAASNSGYQAATNTYSWNHTCTGSNRFLAVDVSLLSAGQTVTGITYNGVALSLIGAQSTVTSFGRVECWGLVNPASGSNSIVVTISGSVASSSAAVSYTGVHQTVPTEAFNSAQATNVGAADATVTITTIADNDWIHAAIATSDTAITAGQTTRNNVTGAGGSGADEDFGPQTPAGAKAMTYTDVGAVATWAIGGYGIRPVAAASAARQPYYYQLLAGGPSF